MLSLREARNLNTLIRVKKDLDFMTMKSDSYANDVLNISKALDKLIKSIAKDNVTDLFNDPAKTSEVQPRANEGAILQDQIGDAA